MKDYQEISGGVMDFDIYHYAREAKKAVEAIAKENEALRAENEAYKQLVDFIIAGNSLDDKDRLSAYEQLLKMASQAAKGE